MWEKIFNLAISNGIWAVLFLALLVFQLKDSRTREQKYQKTIENLSTSLEVVKDVKEDVSEIKAHLNMVSPKSDVKTEVADEK